MSDLPVLKSTITHEALGRVAKAPTTFPAWVLRAVASELQDTRRDLSWALSVVEQVARPDERERVASIRERYEYADATWPTTGVDDD